MRYLPVFLDLQSGTVLLVGAGDLVRAKLRLLVSAGARVRWYATGGDHDLAGLAASDAARIETAKGDPLSADLSGVIAILCAGADEQHLAALQIQEDRQIAHPTLAFPNEGVD